MRRKPGPVEAISHRIRAHKAALFLAEGIGNPPQLESSIRATEVRLAEAEDCLMAVLQQEARTNR